MDRRRFLATFVAAGVTVPFVAEAQPPGRVARIGFLSSGTSDSALPIHEALRQGLRKSGWVEKQNILIEYRFADGHERLHALAAELVGSKST